MGGHASGTSGVPQLPGAGGPNATTGAGTTGGGMIVVVVLVVVVVAVGGGVQAASDRTAATQRNPLIGCLLSLLGKISLVIRVQTDGCAQSSAMGKIVSLAGD
jgi:hypothetical protein